MGSFFGLDRRESRALHGEGFTATVIRPGIGQFPTLEALAERAQFTPASGRSVEIQ